MNKLTKDKEDDYFHELATHIETDGLTYYELFDIVFWGYEIKRGKTYISKTRVKREIVLLLCVSTDIDFKETKENYIFDVRGYDDETKS